MRYRSDILLKNGDLYINPNTGDFDFGPSDVQHLNDILLSAPGWWKRKPTLGVGIMSYLKSKVNPQKLVQSIRLNCQADGYAVNEDFSFQGFDLLKIINNASLL
jgi:hypothetical protein